MKVAIMLPTYNEAENIENLINEIYKINADFYIVAVDDDSPDGTGAILDKLSNINPHLKVTHRKDERGRGKAGIRGFQECMKLNPDIVIEMDADFSHRPEFIPYLLKEIKNADVVIASRYVNGGADKRDFLRRTISRVANYYIKIISGINIHDFTSGFRAFNASLLQSIDLNKLTSSGPSIVQEVLFELLKRNAKIIEVPYTFYDRNAGESKLSLFLLFKTLLNITVMGIRFRFKWSQN